MEHAAVTDCKPVIQVLKALEAAQKEPKAPLSDLFTDGELAHLL